MLLVVNESLVSIELREPSGACFVRLEPVEFLNCVGYSPDIGVAMSRLFVDNLHHPEGLIEVKISPRQLISKMVLSRREESLKPSQRI